jgi:hypothetical protein
MFCFRDLHKLKEQPAELSGDIFDKLFELTDINKLNLENMGFSMNDIVQATGLTPEQIRQIKN